MCRTINRQRRIQSYLNRTIDERHLRTCWDVLLQSLGSEAGHQTPTSTTMGTSTGTSNRHQLDLSDNLKSSLQTDTFSDAEDGGEDNLDARYYSDNEDIDYISPEIRQGFNINIFQDDDGLYGLAFSNSTDGDERKQEDILEESSTEDDDLIGLAFICSSEDSSSLGDVVCCYSEEDFKEPPAIPIIYEYHNGHYVAKSLCASQPVL